MKRYVKFIAQNDYYIVQCNNAVKNYSIILKQYSEELTILFEAFRPLSLRTCNDSDNRLLSFSSSAWYLIKPNCLLFCIQILEVVTCLPKRFLIICIRSAEIARKCMSILCLPQCRWNRCKRRVLPTIHMMIKLPEPMNKNK